MGALIEVGAQLGSWLLGPLGFIAPLAAAALEITQAEVTFFRNHLYEPAIEAIQTAARTHDWNYVGGISARFVGHGYCLNDPEKFVVTAFESQVREGELSGAVHPNEAGHQAIADRLEQVLLPLVAGGPDAEAGGPYE